MKTLVLDVELTGLPPKNADYKTQYMDFPYIVSLAYKINDQPTREFIINQEGRQIPEESIAIHGITNEMAQASPHRLFTVLRDMVLEAQELNFSVGHNIYFDSSLIKANVLRGMKEDPEYSTALYPCIEEVLHKDRRVDTMKSTIKFCNLPGKYGPKWPKLTELHFKLFGEYPAEAHSSGADVDTTYKCYMKLLELGILKQ